MKLLSLFSGIGAFERALRNIGQEYEVVGFSEIDKYAIKSYCAIHNIDENLNLGDITKIDINNLHKNIDMITHGSPCQDFSIAGKQAGAEKGSGTRSSLMWNTIDIVEHCLPKYVIWENVKNILSKKHKHNFDNYIEKMKQIGYNSYYQVLNAKDFGVPQNRERVYTISIRVDIDKGNFEFPEKEELKIRLKDMLEADVDEKYYLSDKMKDYILDNNDSQKGSKWEGRANNDILNSNIAHALSVRGAGGSQRAGVSNFVIDDINEEIKVKDLKVKIKNGTKKGYLEAIEGDSINNENEKIITIGNYMPSNYEASRIVDSKGLAPTIKENHGTVTATNCGLRIRKLTPKEYWRLMGFDDEDFEKAAQTNSNTQLYKQAGNSIVVDVLEKIFKQLLKKEDKYYEI